MRDNMFLVFLALCGFASAIDVVHPVHRQDFPLSWNHGEPVSVPFQAYPARPSAGVYRVSRQEFAEPRQYYIMSPYVAHHQTPPRTTYWYPPVNGNRFQTYPAGPMASTNNYIPKLFVPAADQVKLTPQTSVNRPSFVNVPVPQPASGTGADDESVLPATRRPSENEGEPLAPMSGAGVTKSPNNYFSFNDDVEVNFELKDLLAPLKPASTKSAKSEEHFERSRRFAMHTVEVPPSEITPNNFFNLLFRPDEALSRVDSVTASTDVDAVSEKDVVTDLPTSTSTTEATEPAMASEDTPAVIACEYAAEPSIKLIPIETVEVNVLVKPVVYYLGMIEVGASNSGDAEDDSTTTFVSPPEDEESDYTGLIDPQSSLAESTAFPPEGTNSDRVEPSTILGSQQTTSEPEPSIENANVSSSDNPLDDPNFSEVGTTGEPIEDTNVGVEAITDGFEELPQSTSVPELLDAVDDPTLKEILSLFGDTASQEDEKVKEDWRIQEANSDEVLGIRK